MNDKIYPSMVIRSQAEAIELLEQENKQLKDKLEFYSGLELDKTIDKTRLEYNKLQQENKQLKENNISMQEEMARTWEKADLYKEVIEEVREYIEDWLFNAGGNGASMNYEDINELLKILDKAKGEMNNE